MKLTILSNLFILQDFEYTKEGHIIEYEVTFTTPIPDWELFKGRISLYNPCVQILAYHSSSMFE